MKPKLPSLYSFISNISREYGDGRELMVSLSVYLREDYTKKITMFSPRNRIEFKYFMYFYDMGGVKEDTDSDFDGYYIDYEISARRTTKSLNMQRFGH